MSDNQPFSIERTFSASPERVWQALTDVAQLRNWYFQVDDFKPEIGFEFRFAGTGRKGEQYMHVCRITEAEACRKLTHSWRYEGYPGESYVTWELFPDGGGTRLRLTHRGLETFPQDLPDFRKESFAEGWTMITGDMLRTFLGE